MVRATSKRAARVQFAMRDPASLTPHPKNARRHSEAQIRQISDSITEFGFVKPIVVDEKGVILAGHGAQLAAIALELKQVPVVERRGLKEAQKRAYVIADNRLNELSSWDRKLVNAELADLHRFEFSSLKPWTLFSPAPKKASKTIGDGRYLLQCEFETEAELQEMYEEMQKRGVECKLLS